MRRVNVSLDTLDAARFASITRWGRLDRVLDGIAAARAAGLAVKINTVALRGVNEDEFDALLAWCGAQGFDLCLIETMPLGEIDADRTDQYLPLSLVRARLRQRWTLTETAYRTGGPARYFDVAETGTRIGFITPMTHNFCESCNRVRLTCTGRCSCAWARRTTPTCAPCCVAAPTMRRWTRPSGRPSRASRRAMTSLSTAAGRRRRWRAT